MNKLSESQEQILLMQWAELSQKKYPELKLLHHIPNGGSRHASEAANLKRQGVKPGVPDLCLPVARGGYHGLYIEMKSEEGVISLNQRVFLESLNEEGYKAVVCHGFDKARKVIEEYLA